MGLKLSRNSKAWLRSAGVITLVMLAAGGVTFAALQSQQDSLTGNTIETATANLQLSTDGVAYANSHAGFDFNNLIPGGQPVPAAGYSVYLKNAGGTALALKLSVSGAPSNPDSVDLSKVNVLLTTVGSGLSPQSFNLQSLMGAYPGGLPVAGVNLASGAAQQYKLQASMATDAVNGASAGLGNIDLVFSGAAQSN